MEGVCNNYNILYNSYFTKNNLIYYIANMPKGYADNVWESNYTYEAAPYLEDFLVVK